MIFGLESGLGGSLDFGVSKICFVGNVGCGAQTWLYGCGVCCMGTTRRLVKINRFWSGFGGFSVAKMAKNGDFGQRAINSALAFWAHFWASVSQNLSLRRRLRSNRGVDGCVRV